ncbi:nicolin-1 isoform X2 [Fundulus heteroclitus]|uniref:nicolin-1 isoform X2 n=1 Tax=Fundulus heteroclitus TaxID=8078 RepID=UPI000B380A6F|nr:nicolin-1 isoform X2 [Fundulus heteroclitus]
MSKFSDGRQPISCTVKAPVYLQIGESRAETAQSGVCVVDVALPFGKAVSIEEITFKNYYTAYITVRLLRRTSARDGPTKWCTALRDLLLMDNPHTERGSQDYYSIHRDQEPEKEVSDWLSDLILVDQHPDVEGLPDPQTVSSSIQQMWALTEVMQTNQTTASIGRFDVDGCYDIDLLSLT